MDGIAKKYKIVSSDRGRRAALDSIAPSIATITALLALILHQHKRSKHLITPRVKLTHLYDTKDRSARVRSRWLFNRTTAISPKHASLSTSVCACNDSVLLVTPKRPAEAQASIFRAAALYLVLCPSYLMVFPFNELD